MHKTPSPALDRDASLPASADILASDPGPWGKPKGPGADKPGWTPSGGGRKPPGDLNDLFGDFKAHWQRWFGGDNHRGLTLGFLVFFLLWLASGTYQLQPGEQGVVLRFGKFERIASSGLRYHLPTPFESVEIVNSEAVRQTTLGGVPHGGSNGTSGDQILMLSGDENIINISFNVQWKVRDAQDFVFNLPNPEETVMAVSESALREVIGRTPLNDVLTGGKSKVQDETRALIQTTLDRYKAGIDLRQVNLLDASVPQEVVDSVRDVQRAQADQVRQRNEADAYQNDIIPRARGQATRMIQEAEAYKQKVVAEAQGNAARFLSIYLQYKNAETVTRKRLYLETMERVLTGMPKIILENKTGAVPYLPLPAVKSPVFEKEAP